MHTGMLWFDNSQTAFAVKIQKAAEYFEKKHGEKPTLVLVHPSMLSAEQVEARQFEINKLTVRVYRPVLPGHIWLGIADEGEA